MTENRNAGPEGRAYRLLAFVKRPIVLIFIIGIVIRLILAPLLTFGYDVYYWATTIQNFDSGNGLYGLQGYYYTPVWGYILGAVSSVWDMFLNVDLFGIRFTDLLSTEIDITPKSTATLTSVTFNVLVKIPLFISDALVGYLIYWLIKDRTGDEKKSTLGFALWFLCPLVISVSAICGMFDTFSVLFMLLSVILILKDKCFLGGVMFAIAVMTKFFPIFLVFAMLAFIITSNRKDGTALKRTMYAVAGTLITTVLLLLPELLDGTVRGAFSFITGRAGEGVGLGLGAIETWGTIIAFSLIGLFSIFVGWKMYRSGSEDKVGVFMLCALFITLVILLYPPTPQYVLIMLPFLAYWAVTVDRRLLKPWVILSIGATLFSLTGTFTLLLSFGAYGGMPIDTVVSLIDWYGSASFGIPIKDLIYFSTAAFQYIGILSVLWVLVDGYKKRVKWGWTERTSEESQKD